VEGVVEKAVADSPLGDTGAVVTASVVSAANYVSVVQALNTLAGMMEAAEVRRRFFLSLAKTPSARTTRRFAHRLTGEARRTVRGAQALVDRMCVALNEFVDSDRRPRSRLWRSTLRSAAL
jgi:hypothetical protein